MFFFYKETLFLYFTVYDISNRFKLLEDLAERNDIRIVESENNIKQAMKENTNEFKRYLGKYKFDS